MKAIHNKDYSVVKTFKAGPMASLSFLQGIQPAFLRTDREDDIITHAS
jgi:hypothetical protein